MLEKLYGGVDWARNAEVRCWQAIEIRFDKVFSAFERQEKRVRVEHEIQ
jgi:hypothetical protein